MLVKQQSRKLRKLGELLDQIEQGQTAFEEEWQKYQRTFSQSEFNLANARNFSNDATTDNTDQIALLSDTIYSLCSR